MEEAPRNELEKPVGYDDVWKECLFVLFEQFMQLFFPQVHREIDWERGFDALKQELQTVIPDAEVGKRFVDLLMKVYKKSGEEAWVYIHIEVQSQRDLNLPKRMYIYNNRLFLKHERAIMSLVILGDDRPNWHPQRFEYELWGCEVSLKFPTVKLLDYRDRIDELKQSGNPFAYFVIAHLKTLETRKNPLKRLSYKEAITLEILKQEMDLQEKRDLSLFVDLLMVLPEELEETFLNKVEEFKESNKMPLVAPMERYFTEKGKVVGREEGIMQEAQAALLDNLGDRFGEIPSSMIERMQKIEDITLLRKLRRQVFKMASLEEFDRLILEQNEQNGE